MTPRGGNRGHIFGKKSRKQPITKVSVYESSREKLKELSYEFKIPVVEIIYRILNHTDFPKIQENIKYNVADNWHEQDIEKLSVRKED